jgi:hypothetical protein
LAKACIQGRYEATADPPKKVENDKIVESATLARHQINVTRHTGVMHLAWRLHCAIPSRRSGSPNIDSVLGMTDMRSRNVTKNIAEAKCRRSGQYRKRKLIERYGAQDSRTMSPGYSDS